MKSTIFMLMLITITSCSSQKTKYNLKTIKIKISQLNSEHNKVDLSLYDQYKLKLENSNENKRTTPNRLELSSKKYFYKSYDSYHLDEYDKNKKIKETKVNFDNTVDVVENIDQYFDYYESYYVNGNIKSKLITSWLGFNVGKSYEYDENGTVLEIKDWDKDYQFTFKDILFFLDKIPLEIHRPTPIQISKNTINNVKTWVISFPDIRIKKNVTYVLNGLDGAIINQYEENLPTFKHTN